MVCPERKSIEPIALNVGHGDVSGLQKFVGAAPWADDDVMAEAQALFTDELVPSAAGSPVGTVGVIDESAFTKKGRIRRGVAAAHAGADGPAPVQRPRWPMSTAGVWAGSSTRWGTSGKSAGRFGSWPPE